MIHVKNLSKTFTLHNQGGTVIEVMRDAAFTVARGECVGLTGAPGAGKSTLMRMIWGNYLAAPGSIFVGDTDLTRARPREIIALRRTALGYVSQFLRVVPRVPTVDVVAGPLLVLGVPADDARARTCALLKQLKIPERLWGLTPTTFSGGEQQRVNITRGFVNKYPALLTELATGQVAGRGRETGTQIAARLGRSMDPLPAGLDVVTVSNDGALEDTVGHALTALYPEMS